MKVSASRIVLWLLVVTLGIEIGAGIYEACVLLPLWAGAPPGSLVAYNLQALRPQPGPNFWIVLTPLVGLLGLANLVAAWRSSLPQRRLWLWGASGVVCMVVATFAYFVPTLLGFEALRQVGDETVAASVHLWVMLNWVRGAVYVAAWFCLLHAYGYGAESATRA